MRRTAWQFGGVVLLGLVCGAASTPGAASWDLPQRYRIAVTVGAGGQARRDLPVEVAIDFTALLRPVGAAGPVNVASVRVVEVNDTGGPLDEKVPCQLETGEGKEASSGKLVFLMKGETAARAARRFHLYFDTAGSYEPAAHPVQVKLTDKVAHQEQESYRIETPAATYLYHKLGAGFASLIDGDGHDWISYRPTGGSAGNHRGIPNLVHPEGYFHPGGLKCNSRIAAQGPLRVRIASEADEGKWACTWDIYPGFARLTILKAPKPYWFLYEGTPGGKLDEDGDYYVLSSGEKHAASARWDKDIPSPEWLYFGDKQLRRVLYLVHHDDDAHVDAYWPMQGNMTVFGFGRHQLKKFLDKTPTRFTVGLCEETEYAGVRAVIEGVSQPLAVKLGKVEAKVGG